MESFILDFIIVVLGILFALFLNKLNEGRIHRKRIKNIMNIVIHNFNSDLETLKKVLHNISRYEKGYKKFIDVGLMKDKKIENRLDLSTGFPSFNISTRGYNLLKDSKVDFDFKDSDLISDIVNTYDFYLDMISSYSSFLKDNIDRNLRSFSVHPWSIDYYEKKVTQGYIDYLFTDEHRGRVAHHVTLVIGPWKNTLIAYQDDVKDILERINISNYR